jgi:hypothetical protein
VWESRAGISVDVPLFSVDGYFHNSKSNQQKPLFQLRRYILAKIFVVNQDYQATVKAFKVDQDYKADILVYVVSQDFKAKDDCHWYYTSQDYQATTKLYWVSQDHKADLKVYFVQQDYQAKWKKGHKLQNRL